MGEITSWLNGNNSVERETNDAGETENMLETRPGGGTRAWDLMHKWKAGLE